MNLSLEYIAGFFDGEGCVGIYRNRCHGGKHSTYAIAVNIGQIEPTVLRFIKERWGGALGLNRRSQKLKNRQDCWYWRSSGRIAVRFLKDIQPYLVGKRAQVDLALEYQAQRLKPGHNYRRDGGVNRGEAYSLRLKAMKRGVETPLQ